MNESSLVEEIVSRLVSVSKALGRRDEIINKHYDYSKELEGRNKELTEANEKMRLHQNKLAADKKQAEKELEHVELVLGNENKSLKIRCLRMEGAILVHPDFVDFFKKVNIEPDEQIQMKLDAQKSNQADGIIKV